METSAMTRRYHDMDFIRAAAMLLGLILHVCIFFMPPENPFWGSGEYVGDEVNRQFLSFIHLFRMQLFFMMAGFFAQLVIDRKGYPHLVRDRCKRILIPFVVGLLLLMPIHLLLMHGGGGDNYYNNTFEGLSFPERLRSVSLFGVIDDVPGLKDNLIHYWFLFYLLIFYALHFLLRPVLLAAGIMRVPGFDGFIRLTAGTRWGFLALAVLSFPFQYLIVDIFLPPSGFNVPVLDLSFYLVFYLFGIGLYINRELLGVLARHAWFLIAISAPFILLVSSPSDRIDLGAPVIKDITTWTVFDTGAAAFASPVLHWEGIFHSGWDKVLMAFIRAALCWTLCLGFIGLAHRLLVKPRPAIRYLADSAYWVYWIHLPITFKLSYLGQQVAWGSSLFKSYVVLLLSTFLIYWSYNAFVRYGWLGDFFMGSRKSRTDPGEAEFAMSNILRRSAPSMMLLGALAFLLGAMLDYERSDQDSPVLVEAFVTRDKTVLESCESIDDIRDHYGNTPLHNAARRGEGLRIYDPLPILIAKASHLDARNDFGRTALFVAVRTGNRNDVLALLNAGADPNIADDHGHTPAHVAAIKAGARTVAAGAPYLKLLDDLQAHGADLDLTDDQGRTVAACLEDFGGGAHREAANR